MNSHRVVEVNPVFVAKLLSVATITAIWEPASRGFFTRERLGMLLSELRHELLGECLNTCSRDNKSHAEAFDAKNSASQQDERVLLRNYD